MTSQLKDSWSRCGFASKKATTTRAAWFTVTFSGGQDAMSVRMEWAV
jgi:hypothetical protein